MLSNSKPAFWSWCQSGARFTRYLTSRPLSYDNDKVTIDLRRTSNLQNISRRTQGFVRYYTTYLQDSKIVGDSVRTLAYDIPRRNLSPLL